MVSADGIDKIGSGGRDGGRDGGRGERSWRVKENGVTHRHKLILDLPVNVTVPGTGGSKKHFLLIAYDLQ